MQKISNLLASLVTTSSQKGNLLLRSSAAIALGFISVASVLTPHPSQAQTARWCWCTDYVANRFSLRGYPNAKDWNDGYLQRNGFRQISQPQVGAVVVMESTFPGANTSYGHVGIVNAVKAGGKIDVRGASQIGNQFTEAGCNNVTVIGFGTSVTGRKDISFWVR